MNTRRETALDLFRGAIDDAIKKVKRSDPGAKGATLTVRSGHRTLAKAARDIVDERAANGEDIIAETNPKTKETTIVVDFAPL